MFDEHTFIMNVFLCIEGMAAFDCVVDYDEWIECGYFNEEIRARLKG